MRYQLARLETIRIEIRDSRGTLVRTQQERALSPGLHTVEWNGRDTVEAMLVRYSSLALRREAETDR